MLESINIYLLSRMRFFNPNNELRAELLYNNIWYTMAGRVAEKLVGDDYTFEELVAEHIFQVGATGFYIAI